ncbi:DUF1553 domain-containing protein [Tautonia plasticadhaerens]|uniref:Planctomycete cytochrome C n=1 Tax=Tautonia plasticadhaerens TaxID=2527974 RepID=A0A518HE11_9BACT|nr:DUF1553 domain-containing protein [Tautonia plasticadhaerens]QDV39080.1 Planctomycete cytochrome C [Tautonia plasticadhaerens]
MIRTPRRSIPALLILALAAIRPGDARSGEDRVDFRSQIRPILSDACFHCHGPDAGHREAGLRLDVPEGAFGETASGALPVVPGEPDESELVWRITADDEFSVMPPPDSGRSLTREQIDLLTRWVEQGADWERHWSFSPIADEVALPGVGDESWPTNPIDRFVLARLEAEGLRPSPEASRERLIRRVTLDLTGLPPTVEEIDAFLGDCRPDAYERLVDRLLASPRFGEHRAVGWLDLARYADTYGYQADVYRAVWPWRDWVVRAFNENLPYDEFVTRQLAGDLLPDASPDSNLATAFNRLHRMTNEGGSIEEEFRLEYVADRTDTFGTAFLGLTLGCARCHDHKYDPISQRNYYELSSFFDDIDESGLYSHFTDATPSPTLMLYEGDEERRIRELEGRIRTAEAELDAFAEARRDAFDAWVSETSRAPTMTGLIGDFPLDAPEGDAVPNRADPGRPGKLLEGPEAAPGKVGGGIRLDGEDSIVLPMGNFTRDEPFSVALWAKTPDAKDRAVIFHRSRAWTDAGSRGYQLLIEDGRLGASLVHFWPGNAIGIRAVDPMPLGEWVHVAVTYDGSSRADGLTLFVDGKPAEVETVRDHLFKDITGGGGDELTFGQRFRDRGFKGGSVDELKVFDRELTPIEVEQLSGGEALASALASTGDHRSEYLREQLFSYYLANHDDGYRERLDALEALRKQRSAIVEAVPEIMVMREMAEARPTFLLERGAYDAKGDRVDSDTPESLPPFPDGLPRDRLGLARWLTDPEHPLTARVAVNRFWGVLFGRGLVATPEDFGNQGASPSHPGLLDWLARSFVDSGWDVKRLFRQVVLSSTYRQDSDASSSIREADPENRLLARGPGRRLRAEAIRDAALSASGLLVETIGGPPVKPYQPPGIWEENSGQKYERDPGPGSRRRSLYTYWKRTAPPPSMITLDASGREVCTVDRPTTATPLQALLLLNDPQYVEAARALASRSWHARDSIEGQISHAFRSLLGRAPSPAELDVLLDLFEEQREEFRSGRADPGAYLSIGDEPPDPSIDPVDQAAFAVLVQALFNHDETQMKR